MVGDMGAKPSHPLLDAHGKSVSSALSAMQPAKPSAIVPSKTKASSLCHLLSFTPLVSEDDIVGFKLILFPRAENVANDIVLAFDFLTGTDTSDKFARFAFDNFP